MKEHDQRAELLKRILKVKPADFDELALDIFRYQAAYNPLYGKFISLLSIDIEKVKWIKDIPCLPISLFKNYKIQSGKWEAEMLFTSSGTTGQIPGKHYIRSLSWYQKISQLDFSHFYGHPGEYCILALLPSYLERQGSSLVFMVQDFIKQSKYKESGFFLDDFKKLKKTLLDCESRVTPTLLIGVSFGLLDFAEQYSLELKNTIVMETGGMKGRRKEITRQDLHGRLQKAFHLKTIHSEYGMTELMSQAYSKGKGLFFCSPTMKVFSREITDPLSPQKANRTGAINIIDLANLDSCSFIATDDLGRVFEHEGFEILGRMDSSDIRGCNLMVGED